MCLLATQSQYMLVVLGLLISFFGLDEISNILLTLTVLVRGALPFSFTCMRWINIDLNSSFEWFEVESCY